MSGLARSDTLDWERECVARQWLRAKSMLIWIVNYYNYPGPNYFWLLIFHFPPPSNLFNFPLFRIPWNLDLFFLFSFTLDLNHLKEKLTFLIDFPPIWYCFWLFNRVYVISSSESLTSRLFLLPYFIWPCSLSMLSFSPFDRCCFFLPSLWSCVVWLNGGSHLLIFAPILFARSTMPQPAFKPKNQPLFLPVSRACSVCT